MSWLKRNFFLVIGGVVALALLGVAGFYLFSQKQQADAIAVELNKQIEELKALNLRDPYPNQENIEAVKREQKRAADLLEECGKFFMPTAYYTNMDGGTFQELLESMLREVRRGAEAAGVALPSKNYAATFGSQRATVVFTQSDLVPLAHQVADVGALCEVLFKARIHALLSLRRVPVSRSDQGTTEFLTGRRSVTNANVRAVVTPYEVTFQGFSTELAGVLEGLYRSPHCFVVKNINAERMTATVAAEGEATGAPAYQPVGVPTSPTQTESPGDLMRRRYGAAAGGRYGRGVPTPPTAPPPSAQPTAPGVPVKKGPETVLDEKPLKFTLLIESVKLLPSGR
jgi:hypothetical protein